MNAHSLADEIENDPTFEWEEEDDGEPEVLNFDLDFEATLNHCPIEFCFSD